MATPQLLTKREAATRARMSVSKLTRLIRNGEGPAVIVLGARELFTEDALNRWFADRTASPESCAA